MFEAAIVPLPGTYVRFVVIKMGKHSIVVPCDKRGASGQMFVETDGVLRGRTPIPWLVERQIRFEDVQRGWQHLEAQKVTLEEALSNLVNPHGPIRGWEEGKIQWAGEPGSARLVAEMCCLPDWLPAIVDAAGEFRRRLTHPLRPIIDWRWVINNLDLNGWAEIDEGKWDDLSSAVRIELGLSEGVRIACLQGGFFIRRAKAVRRNDPRDRTAQLPTNQAEGAVEKPKDRIQEKRLEKHERGGSPIKGTAGTPMVGIVTGLHTIIMGDGNTGVLGWPDHISDEEAKQVMATAVDEEVHLLQTKGKADLNYLLEKHLAKFVNERERDRNAKERQEKLAVKAQRRQEIEAAKAGGAVMPHNENVVDKATERAVQETARRAAEVEKTVSATETMMEQQAMRDRAVAELSEMAEKISVDAGIDFLMAIDSGKNPEAAWQDVKKKYRQAAQQDAMDRLSTAQAA